MNAFVIAETATLGAVDAVTSDSAIAVVLWFLATIFLLSGVSKWRHPVLAGMALVDFGLLRFIRPSIGRAVGIAEVALAASLSAVAVLDQAAIPVLMIAALLLWFFALIIARSLRSGQRFACFCFGDAVSLISVLTFVRTVGLAVLASAALIRLWLAPIPESDGLWSAQVAMSGAALCGSLGLLVHIPDLLRWNRGPLRLLGAEGAS